MFRRRCTFPVLLALLLAAVPPATGATLTVGTDVVACDHIDLQQAISAAGSGDTLQVAALTFTGVAGSNFNLVSKSLNILGGYDAGCTGARSTAPTTLAGGGDDSVLEIGGSSTGGYFAFLEQLIIEGGEDDPDDGGGIEIGGAFNVILIDVTVRNNTSDRGGGIHLDGAHGATLYLERVTVASNTAAVDGAGVYCTGGAFVRAESGVAFHSNFASGNGGGLWSDGCRVDLGGFFFYGNIARGDGGGAIYARGGSDIGTLDGEPRRGIVFNWANGGSGFGGGIYATGTGTEVQLWAVEVTQNTAKVTGGAIYAEDDAYVALTGYRCASLSCQDVAFNDAVLGTALASLTGADVLVRGYYIRENGFALGGPLVYAANGGEIAIEDSFVFGNEAGGASAMAQLAGGDLDLDHVTVAGNEGAASFIGGSGKVVIRRSVFDEVPGLADDAPLFAPGWSGTGSFHCGVVPTGTTIPVATSDIVFGDAKLESPRHGLLHLRSDSPAVDLCATGHHGRDIDGDARPNNGRWDAGADEHIFPVFVDGFESGDTALWSAAVGGS